MKKIIASTIFIFFAITSYSKSFTLDSVGSSLLGGSSDGGSFNLDDTLGMQD